jgi:AraC-like DNA-binding protein
MTRMRRSIDYYAAGFHHHEHYEFIMPEIDIPEGIVGDSIMLIKKGMVFPINSEQPHGTAKAISDARINTININKALIDKTALSMLGTRTFFFRNENHALGNELRSLVSMYINEIVNRQDGFRFILESIECLIAAYLIRRMCDTVPKHNPDMQDKNTVIERALEYMRENYSRGCPLDDVAAVVCLSPYHFIRTFRKHTGKTPHEYLVNLKIEKACDLLIHDKHSITETSFMCGFNNTSHFSTVFRRIKGISPSKYRKMHW